MKETVKQRTVFEDKRAKIFVDGKNAVTVRDIYKFKGHSGSAFHGIFVAAGRTETTVTAERDKLKFTAVWAAVHCATERGIATVDHLIDIFHLGFSGMKSIFNFFIIVGENFL